MSLGGRAWPNNTLHAELSFAPPVINSYGGRSLPEQSHGESFLALMLNRFGGNGFYILDEPEAALSPTRQLAVLRRMHQLVGERSQFIIATHSPIVDGLPWRTDYVLDCRGFMDIRYEDTEHYAVTRGFLNNPDQMLSAHFRRLLGARFSRKAPTKTSQRPSGASTCRCLLCDGVELSESFRDGC